MAEASCSGWKPSSVAKKQIQIAEEGLIVLQQGRPCHYSELDVWNMLTELDVLDPYHMQCYRFLCKSDQKKQLLFGTSPKLRLEVLLQMMVEVGIQWRAWYFHMSFTNIGIYIILW